MPAAQLINATDDFLTESLAGFELAYAGVVRCHTDPAYVTRRVPARPEKVALVSGGGSGHEPLHAGFVGTGMLDVAVPGLVFSSPTPFQLQQATLAGAGTGGVVHIVKNYTGDVLNFAIAADLLQSDGLALDTVLVDDDLATDRPEPDGPGRRGTGAVVTIEKVCGAAAERGAPLAAIAELGRRVNRASRTLAFAMSGCTHPGEHRPSFELPDGECELGVGIHGERGGSRITAPAARDLTERLVEPLVASLGLGRGAAVVAIVNDLGATPTNELYLLYGEVHKALRGRGISVARSLVGRYVTALDMRGCSLTLTVADDELVELWDAPVHTPALHW